MTESRVVFKQKDRVANFSVNLSCENVRKFSGNVAVGAAQVLFGVVDELITLDRPVLLDTAGRTTLTLYVLHVLVFDLLVDHLEWIRPGGLGTSLAFAAAFWVAAVVAANVWSRFRPLGPLEWWYRRFSRA